MNKKTIGAVIVKLGKVFRFLSHNRQRVILRLTALFLLTALLTPIFLFDPTQKATAQVKSAIQQPAPTSEPPQAFLTNNNNLFRNSITAGFASLVSFSTETISNLFDKKSMPDGLELPDNYPSVENSVSENSLSENVLANMPLAQPSGSVDFDFDGDGKADLARWHPATTEWKVKNSLSGTFTTHTIGNNTSIIAPGRFDNDSITDVAVFNSGTWTIKKSTDGTTITVSFGTSGDKPVVGDYDGDGLSDIAVFRPSTNAWWILQSSNSQTVSTSFGLSGDITAQGNFDGDSKTDIAVYRPSTGDWHISGSSVGYFYVHWGLAADIPVPADFDGDGKTDLAVYRGSTGTWYILKSSTNGATYDTQTWGNYGDQPVPADYDNDGKADYSIWRPTTGVWHTIKSNNGNPQYDYQTLGQAGDTAVSSAYLKQIGGAVVGYDLAKVRLSPKNETGGTDLYSQNFGWGTGLVGLSGRSGMGAGFGLSYNSLVWTKEPDSNTMYFDADNANVSPGFRFGFPTIEPIYWDKYAERFNYLMVTPSGARIEFRQVNGASDTYETADSSYLQLKTVGANNPGDPVENFHITVQGTDGSKMTYLWKAGAFRCSEIKDRNGNIISINHDEQGLLRTVTDTLGRVITVNYDTELYPTSITQTWKDNNGAGSNVTYTWASFTYATTTISTNFASGINVVGPANDTLVKVLEKVTFPNGGYTTFEYNGYAQVKKVNNFAADNSALSYVRTNLDNPSSNQTDCPRFTETGSWVANFNIVNNQAQEIVITNTKTENQSYSLPGNISGTATKIEVIMSNHPHGAISKTFVGSSGWQEGLPIATEDWANGTSGSERKRWTWSEWTQDDENLMEILNPRVIESRVGDSSNIKKSTTQYRLIPYTTIAEYGLVEKVEVFDSNLSTVLKSVETDYNWNSAYTSRRIIGLPSQVEVWGFNQQNSTFEKVSEMTYQYDEGNFSDSTLEQNISNAVQHDYTNYGSSFITGRGNLTSTTRVDVSTQTSSVTSSVKYNTTGAPVAQIDPLGRTVKIGYTDNFNDTTTSRNTYAYPTRLTEVANTDPNNNYSEVKYRFDNGANVWAKSPKPANNDYGKETTRLYDSIGRLQKETIVNTGAYTRYEYPTSFVQSKVYSTIIDTNSNGADSADEVYSESWTDGAGRVRKSLTEHPGSTSGWTGTLTEYDILGQVKRSTVPTEINSSYVPSGDDYRGVDSNNQPIWLWNSQEYDWKGRVTRSIPTDSNGSDGKDQLISYEGCGCAGGQVTTIQGELVPKDTNPNETARRTQKIYEDILGRTWKTEVLNWDGSTVYTTTVQGFNGRDQVFKTRQYAGATSGSTYQTLSSSAAYQDVTMTYDGHGRMKTRHYPIEDAQTETTWIYNSDDSIQQVIDPRGAIQTFSYNTRGLVSQISYDPPENHPEIPDTPTVTFNYDALGNRTSIDTAGVNETSYSYDSLSRLTSETVDFDDLTNNLTITYDYNLGGGLKSITDPFDYTVDYTNDKTGRLNSVTGDVTTNNSTGNYANNIKYRSFGSIKQIDYLLPSGTSEIKMEYDNRLRVSHSEVTKSGGYIMKADYNYFADSRLQAKDDLMDNKWDNTLKYDFAGRLTFNQFGMGLDGNGSSVRVYEQTLQYDGFSMMTQRSGLNWGAGIGFANGYQNGRIQNFLGTYDAAGNIVASTEDEHRPQYTTYDAAGRRTAMIVGWEVGGEPQQVHYVYENKTEYIFDGDGRPVKEGRGSRQVNVENPPPLTISEYGYQVWSTVLGKSLTTVNSDGAKGKTNIYAGGALIASQGASGSFWTTADPVTGTTANFLMYNNETFADLEQREPLGQTITNTAPPEEGLPTYTAYKGNVGEPEWQCEAPPDFYGSFSSLPWHCQREAMRNAGIDTPYKNEKQQNPQNINLTDSPMPDFGAENSASDEVLAFAAYSTAKQQDEDRKKGKGRKPKLRKFEKRRVKPKNLPNVGKTEKEEKATNKTSPSIWDTEEKINAYNEKVANRAVQLYLIVMNTPQDIKDVLIGNKKHVQSNELVLCQGAIESGGVGWRKYLNVEETRWQGVENNGDLGLMQIQRATANQVLGTASFREEIYRDLGGRTSLTLEEVRDYEGLNVALATQYLQNLVNQFSNDGYQGREAVRLGLAAYNGGRKNILDYGLGTINTADASLYADSVLLCERILQNPSLIGQ